MPEENKINTISNSFPDKNEALSMLNEAAEMNPGPWKRHSLLVAQAAQAIAGRSEHMDPEKAYVLGLLHDIGRRFGKGHLAHVYDGYQYLMTSGYPAAAKVALTHSFNLGRLSDYIGRFDIEEEKQRELDILLEKTEMDDYDRLIQLCDSIATGDSIVTIEERMEDVKQRYGAYPEEKLQQNLWLKHYFEEMTGADLYQMVMNLT